ncbi:nuclear transport factor 2 family protein [Streptosporangium sp. NPDC000396]|uniref:nuclear transport factor 2 family protein n=1 Tax=Streptosporangium sp. NPDC000396 TaxID=3366185 RepID=UPI0036AFA98E
MSDDFVTRWAAFWNAPDPARLDTLTDPDIVLRWPGQPEPIRGRQAWSAQVAGALQRFPDLRLEVTGHAFNDDLSFISWRATATANGEVISWEGIDRMRLKNGVVVDSMVAFDTAGLRPAGG